MADNDKKEGAAILPAAKPAVTPKGFLERFNTLASLTPMGLFDKVYGSQVRGSLRDFAVNIVDTVGTLTVGSQRGDKYADWLKDSWDKVAEPVDGQSDFRMAKGWKMPEGMRYNGKLPNEWGYEGPAAGKEIKPALAFFFRDKQGKVEVLDSNDPKFISKTGIYMAIQVGLMATVGTKGITSLKSALALTQGWVAKAGTAAYLGLASADLYGGGIQIAESLAHSIFLKPEAIDRFAHIIDKPESLTLTQMQKDLNLILEQYAKKSGRNTAQYYIPPVTSPAGTMELLDQMSKGQVKGFVRAHAFAEIADGAKKENISIGNIREITENPYFKRSFLMLSIKAIQGQSLNENERMALRFGMNIIMDQKELPLTVAADKSDFTLHAQALKVLRGYLTEPFIADKLRKAFEEDKNLKPEQVDAQVAYGVKNWVELGRKDKVPDQDILASLNKELASATAVINLKEKQEMQRAQAQAQGHVMAFPSM